MRKPNKLLLLVLIATLLMGCTGNINEKGEEIADVKTVIMCMDCGSINPNRNGYYCKTCNGTGEVEVTEPWKCIECGYIQNKAMQCVNPDIIVCVECFGLGYIEHNVCNSCDGDGSWYCNGTMERFK